MPDLYDKLAVNVVYTTPPLQPPDWWFLDNGLPLPEPEPTPEELALKILEPELKKISGYVPIAENPGAAVSGPG